MNLYAVDLIQYFWICSALKFNNNYKSIIVSEITEPIINIIVSKFSVIYFSNNRFSWGKVLEHP